MALTKKSQTEILADLISKTTYSDIPSSAIQKAKECIIDILGCAYGAWSDIMTSCIYDRVKELCADKNNLQTRWDSSTIWGKSDRLPILESVFINGVLSHSIELDDLHRYSKVHAGAVVIPAAFASGERMNVSGQELLRAIVLGYEVSHRIGVAINVVQHRNKGWHATSTIGCFGAAVASGILLHLNKNQLVSALGLAGTQASGLWAFLADGAGNKRFHAGKAANSGLLAAELAQAGLTGPSMIIEAKDGGLFSAMSNQTDIDGITIDWGKEYLIESISFKPFACCRSLHPTVTAILDLRSENNLSPSNVQEVEIDTYNVAVKQCNSVNWPHTSDAARFNIQYVVAVALHDGKIHANQFTTEKLNDKQLRKSAPFVKMRTNSEFDDKYPKEWGCRVRIQLRDGNVLQKTVKYPLGDPENPISHDAILDKFYSLATVILPFNQAENIVKLVSRLETIDNIREIYLGKGNCSGR
jgi:2-methylcitrate dehydratase PrpD